jgi:hypothetical protein
MNVIKQDNMVLLLEISCSFVAVAALEVVREENLSENANV